MKKLIVYMPAYNEEKCIKEVINSIPTKIEGIEEVEILVVDDGSLDKTAEFAKEMGASVISHHQNKGLGIAFQTAANYALKNKADILASIDADGQFYAEDIKGMIKPIFTGSAHLVTGSRFFEGKPDDMASVNYYGNLILSKIISLLGNTKLMDVSCGFRAYSREALFHINLFGVFSYTHEVILNLAFKGLAIKEYPIKVKYFLQRKSTISSNVFRYAYKAGKIIFRTVLDYKPLRLFGVIGIMCLITSFGFELFLFIHYFINNEFTPFKSMGFIGLGFGIFGLLILLLGMVADMLNRIRLNQEKILSEIKKINSRDK